MPKLSASALITARVAEIKAAAAARGLPVADLIRHRKVPAGAPIVVRDTAAPGRPERLLEWAPDARSPVLVVRTIARQPRDLERIDLTAPGADERLARFAPVAG